MHNAAALLPVEHFAHGRDQTRTNISERYFSSRERYFHWMHALLDELIEYVLVIIMACYDTIGSGVAKVMFYKEEEMFSLRNFALDCVRN